LPLNESNMAENLSGQDQSARPKTNPLAQIA